MPRHPKLVYKRRVKNPTGVLSDILIIGTGEITNPQAKAFGLSESPRGFYFRWFAATYGDNEVIKEIARMLGRQIQEVNEDA